MTAEEILEQHYNRAYTETKEGQTYPEHWPEYVIRAMNQFAVHMCYKQREICAENAETGFNEDGICGFVLGVKNDSIINSPLPEELQ